ncbi:hypothetical protein [Microvirgula aerodenitrificans]|uniref:hypothetical protein n=1 Tax=Microvirgula aerodenitrificans TaxID=57480 RepID=UPI001F37C0DD|nr:hypothetical protein [Microvirgula aerodenitrificans]
MAILKSARRPDLALQFMNFMLEGRNAAQLTNLNGATNPVSTATAFFRPDLKANPVINPAPATVRQWTVLRELEPKERRYLTRLWTRVKWLVKQQNEGGCMQHPPSFLTAAARAGVVDG